MSQASIPASIETRMRTILNGPASRVFRVRPAAIPSAPEEPIRAELFRVERLEQHGERLAAAQRVTSKLTTDRRSAMRLRDNDLAAPLRSALAGARLVQVPSWQVAHLLASGRLRIVLGAYQRPPTPPTRARLLRSRAPPAWPNCQVITISGQPGRLPPEPVARFTSSLRSRDSGTPERAPSATGCASVARYGQPREKRSVRGEPAGYEFREELHALRLACLALGEKPNRSVHVQLGPRHPRQ